MRLLKNEIFGICQKFKKLKYLINTLEVYEHPKYKVDNLKNIYDNLILQFVEEYPLERDKEKIEAFNNDILKKVKVLKNKLKIKLNDNYSFYDYPKEKYIFESDMVQQLHNTSKFLSTLNKKELDDFSFQFNFYISYNNGILYLDIISNNDYNLDNLVKALEYLTHRIRNKQYNRVIVMDSLASLYSTSRKKDSLTMKFSQFQKDFRKKDSLTIKCSQSKKDYRKKGKRKSKPNYLK